MSKKILFIFITILSSFSASAFTIDSAKVLNYNNPTKVRVYYFSSGSGQFISRITSDVINGGTLARVNIYFKGCNGNHEITHDSVDYTISPGPSQNLFNVQIKVFMDSNTISSLVHMGRLYEFCMLNPSPATTDSFYIQAPAPAFAKDYNPIDNEIFIYPNPVSNILHVGLRTDIQIEKMQLYNLLGTKQQLLIIDKNKLDISLLPNGIYILYLQTNKGVLPKRITINK